MMLDRKMHFWVCLYQRVPGLCLRVGLAGQHLVDLVGAYLLANCGHIDTC